MLLPWRDASTARREEQSIGNFTWPVALFVLACAALLVFKVATRDSSTGTDTQNYVDLLEDARSCDCILDGDEPLFAALVRALTMAGMSDAIFFGVISAIQMLAAIKLGWSFAKLMDYREKGAAFVLMFLALLVAFPFFLAMQINVLHQGVGAFFVALAAIQFYRRRFWPALGLIAAGTGFHYSTLMYAAAMPLLLVKPSVLMSVFVGLLLMYVSGASEHVVRLISDASGVPLYSIVAGYGAFAEYRVGIRYDFVVFSLLPLGLTYLVYLFFPSSIARKRMNGLCAIYAVLLVPFLFFGWASYSDRYALGAWLLMPAFGALLVARFSGGLQLAMPLVLLSFSVVFFLVGLSSATS